jgi:hypothetical protein
MVCDNRSPNFNSSPKIFLNKKLIKFFFYIFTFVKSIMFFYFFFFQELKNLIFFNLYFLIVFNLILLITSSFQFFYFFNSSLHFSRLFLDILI